MTSDLPSLSPDRQQLVQAAGHWLAGQSLYPKPVIPSLIAEHELTVAEALEALHIANQLRDRTVRV